MEVILLQDVEKIGLRGEVVDVARGYARNFLLPRRLAQVATAGAVADIRRRDEQRARQEARSDEQAQTIATELRKTVLRFEVQAGPTGTLFGSVTPSEIADEIWRTKKIRVDRRKIATDPIKRIGRYSIGIEVFEGVEVEVKTLVVPEGGELPPEEELAAMAAAEAGTDVPAAPEGATEAGTDPEAAPTAEVDAPAGVDDPLLGEAEAAGVDDAFAAAAADDGPADDAPADYTGSERDPDRI